MNLRRPFNLVLAVLVIAGLSVAPVVTPAAAKAPSAGAMTAMTGDMPCCPGEQKSKDCADCPLVAVCVLKTTQAGPLPTAALPLRYAIQTAHSVLDDEPADGLDRPPPDHPPRVLA
jgi:hypothetical protein